MVRDSSGLVLFDSSFSLPYACHEIDRSSCRRNVAVYLLSILAWRLVVLCTRTLGTGRASHRRPLLPST